MLIKDFQDANKPIIRLLSAADPGYTFYHPTLITNAAVIVSHDTENLIINNYGNSADESKNNLISINIEGVFDLYINGECFTATISRDVTFNSIFKFGLNFE